MGSSSITGLETILFADNASFDGTERGGALATDGQFWIGSTAAPHVRRGTITSPNATLVVGYSAGNITLDLAGGSIGIDSIAVQSGTSPVLPDSNGLITVNGQVVAAGTNPCRTVGGTNTYALQIQISQAIAATDATKIGLSNYNSTHFSVDANGFVASQAITLTNGVNGVFSASSTNLGGSISLRSDILTYVQPGAYPYTALSTDYFISVDSASARTINLPNAPTTGKSYVIKDRIGSAAANNITLTTVGGVVTIDGATSKLIASNYGSLNVVFNGTSYEVY